MQSLKEAIKHCYDISKNQCGNLCGKDHIQLAEWLEELDRLNNLKSEGKLIELPCKIDEKIYTFYETDIEWCVEIGMSAEEIMKELCECRRVCGFRITYDGVWIVLLGGLFSRHINIPIEEFGKTVFLSKEEMLKALEEIISE